MKARLLVAPSLLLLACGTSPPSDGPSLDAALQDAPAEATPGEASVDAGPACTVARWDPTLDALDQWPDLRAVAADPSTATGFRLGLDAARFPRTLASAGQFSGLFTDLVELDGFGVNAQAYFRFTRSFDVAQLPSAEQTLTAQGGVGFVVLSPGAPRLEGALVTSTDRDATLLLAPLHPLPENALVAAYVTRRLTGAARGCLEPSPALTAVLAAPAGDAARAVGALTSLGAISSAQDLVALTVYPTQSTTGDSRAVAADIAARDFSVSARAPCAVDMARQYRACELQFAAGNYLDARHHLPVTGAQGHPSPLSTYTLRATVWLPLAGRGAAPYRTIVYGHGLGGGRSQGARLAEFAAPLGIATVAIDAVSHGEHPLNPTPGANTLTTVLNFFALDLAADSALDARALRDHFRQSTYDKLQLVRLLQRGVDADGDGAVDLDFTHLAYLGVSLGGIMGAEPLALTDAFGAAVLVVPGGRVSGIISDSSTFSPLLAVARPAGVSAGDVTRAFPLLQTILDRGDSASYGPHVLSDRLVPGGSQRVPSTLLGVVLDDDTVPNVCNYTIARAVGVSILPPVLRPAPGLVALAPPPLSGNVAGGRATAGLLQFDLVYDSAGAASRATHSNVGASDVGAEAWLHFLSTHWDRGLAELADPYAALHRAHAR